MNLKLRLKIIERFGSQTNFALMAKEDETLISRVINGRRALPESKKKAWANALETDVQEIFE